MNNRDKKIYDQAFNELRDEGYFDDFIARVNRLPVNGKNTNESSVAEKSRQREYYHKRPQKKKA